MLNSQNVISQVTDSLTHSSVSQGGIQFQLIGGLGLYYIGDWSPVSHFRIGADFSLNHSNQSGSSTGYDIYSNTPPTQQSAQNTTNQPEQTTNSYLISLSALYLQNIVEYKHASIYCGIGPMISYSWYRGVDKSTNSQYAPYDSNTYINNGENTNKTSAIGPLAIVGIRSKLLDHISLSAEIGLSALYQWTMESDSYVTTNISPGPYVQTSNNGSVSHLNGWTISLTDIRIGLIIEL